MEFREFLVQLPAPNRRLLRDCLQAELDRANQALRTSSTTLEMWRAQGRGQYIHGLISTLEKADDKPRTDARPSGTSGY